MGAKHVQKKGARYENKSANALKPIWKDAARGIGQSRNAHEVPDVIGTPHWIEAKERKAFNVHAAYEQGVNALANHQTLPKERQHNYKSVLVISRQTGLRVKNRDGTKGVLIGRDLVTMSLEEFVQLQYELQQLRALNEEP